MPTYGYRCTVCKHEFERVQKMSDPTVAECETCGEPVKKILYPVGISFKGTGFYINDSKPSPAKSATPPKESETKAETPAAESAPDAKPAETKSAETKPAEAKAPEAKTSPVA